MPVLASRLCLSLGMEVLDPEVVNFLFALGHFNRNLAIGAKAALVTVNLCLDFLVASSCSAPKMFPGFAWISLEEFVELLGHFA
jgi:hypothetical protein